MHTDYSDIRALIPIEPIWFDERAVPRYAPFHPDLLANIYADEAVLLEVTCQSCGHVFHVAISDCGRSARLAMRIEEREFHYGDPPNIGCCDAGATMNSEPRRVLEYWGRTLGCWARGAGLEVDVTPDWVKPRPGAS